MSRSPSSRGGRLLPLLLGLGLSAAIGALAYGLEATLRSPTSGERLAVHAVSRLEHIRALVAIEWLGSSKSLRVVCRADRTKLRRTVETDLAGCPQILANELVTRLVRGEAAYGGPLQLAGVPAYCFLLGRDYPRLELVVARRSMFPLALIFRSRRIHAVSVLAPVGSRRRDRQLQRFGRRLLPMLSDVTCRARAE